MADNIRSGIVYDALSRLGFESGDVDGQHTVYRHPPSDTVFIFPLPTPDRLPPMRVASVRRLTVGRGAATERAFDAAMAAAAAAAERRSNGRRRPKVAEVG